MYYFWQLMHFCWPEKKPFEDQPTANRHGQNNMLARLVRVDAGYARAVRLSSAAALRPLAALYGAPNASTPAGVACRRWLSAGPAKGSRQPVALREEDLDESFVKGSGTFVNVTSGYTV